MNKTNRILANKFSKKEKKSGILTLTPFTFLSEGVSDKRVNQLRYEDNFWWKFYFSWNKIVRWLLKLLRLPGKVFSEKVIFALNPEWREGLAFCRAQEGRAYSTKCKGLKTGIFLPSFMRTIKEGECSWSMVGERGPGGIWAWRWASLRYLPPVGLGQKFTRRYKCDGKAFKDFKQAVMFFIRKRPHYCK